MATVHQMKAKQDRLSRRGLLFDALGLGGLGMLGGGLFLQYGYGVALIVCGGVVLCIALFGSRSAVQNNQPGPR